MFIEFLPAFPWSRLNAFFPQHHFYFSQSSLMFFTYMLLYCWVFHQTFIVSIYMFGMCISSSKVKCFWRLFAIYSVIVITHRPSVTLSLIHCLFCLESSRGLSSVGTIVTFDDCGEAWRLSSPHLRYSSETSDWKHSHLCIFIEFFSWHSPLIVEGKSAKCQKNWRWILPDLYKDV